MFDDSPIDKSSPKKQKQLLSASIDTPPTYTIIGGELNELNNINPVSTPTGRHASIKENTMTDRLVSATSDISPGSVAFSTTSDVISSASHVLFGEITDTNGSTVLPIESTAVASPPQNDTLAYPENEPPWLTKLFQRINDIDNKLIARIDAIDNKLQVIDNRVGSVESDLNMLRSLNTRVNEMDTHVKLIKEMNESLREELRVANFEVNQAADTIKENSRIIYNAHQRIDELENRSMRDNLLFTGIAEEQRENTEDVIRNLIKNTLGIRDQIDFERVHRIGPNSSRQPRTIVAKFSRYKDREAVRNNASRLKGTQIGIHEQFCKSVNHRRKILYPRFKQARRDGCYTRLVYDTLIINNEKFFVNHENNIVRDERYDRPPAPRRNINLRYAHQVCF